MPILLEICVDTFESAVAAIEGGADRIELCSALSEGGLTPTVGLLRQIKSFLTEWSKRTGRIVVPIYCMVRCRRGSDFQYSENEMEAMLWDVKLLKEHGADGFVFGALDGAGNVDRKQCEKLVRAVRRQTGEEAIPLTFHRAIDCTDEDELRMNITQIVELGFSTILTSGLKPSALEGVTTILQMRTIAEEIKMRTGVSVEVMPGSGISPGNIAKILSTTGCRSVHGSASVLKPSTDTATPGISMGSSNVDALPLRVCSKAKVEELRRIIDGDVSKTNN